MLTQEQIDQINNSSPLAQNLRLGQRIDEESDDAGGGGGSGGGNTLVYRPGGVQSGNVYTSLTDLLTAAHAIEGTKIMLVDMTGSAPGTLAIAAGTYDFEEIEIHGRREDLYNGQTTLLDWADGTTFTNWPPRSYFIRHRFNNTSAVVHTQTAASFGLFLEFSGVDNAGTQHVYASNGNFVAFILEKSSSISASAGAALVSMTGGLLILLFQSQAGASRLSLVSGSSGTVQALVSSDCTLSGVPSNFTGTYAEVPQGKLHNIKIEETKFAATGDLAVDKSIAISTAAGAITITMLVTDSGYNRAQSSLVMIHNNGGGAVTVAGGGATINGTTSLAVGEFAQYYYDGSAWYQVA